MIEVRFVEQVVFVVLVEFVVVFVKDIVVDGIVMEFNYVFEQIWIFCNEGKIVWFVGCFVMFVGGDYMGYVDLIYLVVIQDFCVFNVLIVCYFFIFLGEEFFFIVLFRIFLCIGRIVFNWCLIIFDGFKFGYCLWCDVKVEYFKLVVFVVFELVKEECEVIVKFEFVFVFKEEVQFYQSQMIFFKFEKELFVFSLYEDDKFELVVMYEQYEDCEDDDWDVVELEEGFMIDEEYDIFDVFDEEYFEVYICK